MAKPLVSDELWEALQPLLPPPKPRRFRYPGRQPVGDRQALTGILFVLKTGIPWEDLPIEMGCGCGMTCWRRLDAWQQAGVWFQLVQVLLQRLDDAGKIDWSRAAVDSTFARAFGGVEGSGKNPTDRGRPGVKQHVLVDGHGIPLAADSDARQHAGDPRNCSLWWIVSALWTRQRGNRSTGRPRCTGTGRTTRSRTARQLRQARHRPEAGQAVHGTRQRLGEVSLGGGAVLLLGARLPQAALRDREDPGDAIRLPQPRLSLSFVSDSSSTA